MLSNIAKVENSQYKLFIMAQSLSEQQTAQVMDYCQQKNIDLCDSVQKIAHNCATVALRCSLTGLERLRMDLKQLARQLKVDLVLLAHREFQRKRKLAVFDMDSTLIQVEVIDELAKKAGVGDQVMSITAATMRGELDFDQSFAQRLGLLKGLDESVLAEIAATLPIMPGLPKLLQVLQQKGYKTAILSGGFNYFANYLQDKYGFDYSYANALEIKQSKVTGRVLGEIVNGERKVMYLREIAEKEGIALSDTIAVGDGANDLPMLAVANLGVAFHAKPLVIEQAVHSISTLGLDALLHLIDEQK